MVEIVKQLGWSYVSTVAAQVTTNQKASLIYANQWKSFFPFHLTWSYVSTVAAQVTTNKRAPLIYANQWKSNFPFSMETSHFFYIYKVIDSIIRSKATEEIGIV